MSSRLSFDQLSELYPSEKFIHLLPVTSKHSMDSRPMYSLDVSEVKIDPHDSNHCYPMKYSGFGENRKVVEVSLTKVAIDLLCAAANVNIKVSRIDDRSNPLYAEYEAAGIIASPDGPPRIRSASVEWDGNLMREKIMWEAQEYVRGAVKKGWSNFKGLSDAAILDEIDSRFAKAWMAEREFGKRKCESKAANRAAAAILAMKRTYPVKDLEDKRFAVAQFVFSPDLSDPETKRQVVQYGLTAGRHLYPGDSYQINLDPPKQISSGDAVIEDQLLIGDPESEKKEVIFDPPAETSGPTEYDIWARSNLKDLKIGLENMGDKVTVQVRDAFTAALDIQDLDMLLRIEKWWKEYK